MTRETIPAVNPDDLRKMWEVWDHMQEQKAGGLTLDDFSRTLSPGADIRAIVGHCIVLKQAIERGEMSPDNIDFEQAAKPVSLPVA
jgi:hypothetical protein